MLSNERLASEARRGTKGGLPTTTLCRSLNLRPKRCSAREAGRGSTAPAAARAFLRLGDRSTEVIDPRRLSAVNFRFKLIAQNRLICDVDTIVVLVNRSVTLV